MGGQGQVAGVSSHPSGHGPLLPTGPTPWSPHHGLRFAGRTVVTAVTIGAVGAQQIGRGQAEGAAQGLAGSAGWGLALERGLVEWLAGAGLNALPRSVVGRLDSGRDVAGGGLGALAEGRGGASGEVIRHQVLSAAGLDRRRGQRVALVEKLFQSDHFTTRRGRACPSGPCGLGWSGAALWLAPLGRGVIGEGGATRQGHLRLAKTNDVIT